MDDENHETSEFVNEVYTVDEKEYLIFLTNHEAQLKTNNVPEQFWKPLCLKLKNQIFDAGNNFSMLYIEPDESNSEDPSSVKVVVSTDLIDPSDGNNIYLIDHAWTFKASEAKLHLMEVPGLLERMGKLMNLSPQSDSLVEDILKHMWKFNLTYSCSALSSVEDQLPLWYIMDEFGSAVQHSDNPNFKIVPFLNLAEGIVYSLLFPLRCAHKGDEVLRDYVFGISDEIERRARLLPWIPSSFKAIDFLQSEPSEDYFISGRILETLPNIDALIPKDTNGSALDSKPLKVFSDYPYINEYLTSHKFSLVTDQHSADILWLTSHFKQYKEFSELYPNKFINQFPFENVITIKDLLAIVSRRNNSITGSISDTLPFLPNWLPTTYNMSTELPKFISYFQHREEKELDNYWICKPWNLARGMDMMITNDLDCIVRQSSSGHKIAQKYIEDPVLFHRDGIGSVKFDVRYVLLLKSVHPLELYVYKNFFLRFANKPFEMCDFDDYEKHFTVMNYSESAVLHRLLCADFVEEFNIQYSNQKWSDIEPNILQMFHEVFESATMKGPPCGIGKSPQSRALYAADLMLSKEETGGIQPKLLEINWTPDCQRACEYYPNFYNDIFELLFLDEEKEGVFYKL